MLTSKSSQIGKLGLVENLVSKNNGKDNRETYPDMHIYVYTHTHTHTHTHTLVHIDLHTQVCKHMTM